MKRLICLPLALSLTPMLSGCGIGWFERDKEVVARAETIPVLAASAPVGSIPVVASPAEDPAAAEARALATILLPEGAGRMLRVREKHFSNGSRQEIVIATDKGTYGENVVDVSIRVAEAGPRTSNPLNIGPPSENGIRSEILSRFPDVQMNIVTRPMRNALGPFGLAIGRHPGGARCIFAWQWMDDLREAAPGSSNLLKMNALVSGKNLATSIRVRLCRSDSTVDQLASQIEGMSVGANPAIERIAGMDRRSVDAGVVAAGGAQGDSLLRPVGGSLEAAIARPVRREAAPKPAVAARPRQAPRRRHVVKEDPEPRPAPVAAPTYVPPVAPPQPAGGYGQRFLAPVSGQQSYGGTPAGYPAAGGSALPPQAYRGPGG